jgi:hypothetical protein
MGQCLRDRRGRLAGLRQELRCLLSRRDPAGVCDESPGFPPDERDCVIGRFCSGWRMSATV